MIPGPWEHRDADIFDAYSSRSGSGLVMTRSATWRPTDLAGGPIGEIFATLRRALPDLRIERLSATHATDDDNVWFITRSSSKAEFQINPIAEW